VQLVTEETDPVLQVHNSKNIVLNTIKYNENAETLLSVMGDKTKGVKLINTDGSKAKKKVEFNYGAAQTALEEK
jgi:hypothetical protein